MSRAPQCSGGGRRQPCPAWLPAAALNSPSHGSCPIALARISRPGRQQHLRPNNSSKSRLLCASQAVRQHPWPLRIRRLSSVNDNVPSHGRGARRSSAKGCGLGDLLVSVSTLVSKQVGLRVWNPPEASLMSVLAHSLFRKPGLSTPSKTHYVYLCDISWCNLPLHYFFP